MEIDPVEFVKGGVNLAAILGIAGAIVKWCANKMRNTESRLQEAHTNANKLCREDNAALVKRLEKIEDESRKQNAEERVIMLQAIATTARVSEQCEQTNKHSSAVLSKLIDKLDITPPQGNKR